MREIKTIGIVVVTIVIFAVVAFVLLFTGVGQSESEVNTIPSEAWQYPIEVTNIFEEDTYCDDNPGKCKGYDIE